jgi:hypothetical protein
MPTQNIAEYQHIAMSMSFLKEHGAVTTSMILAMKFFATIHFGWTKVATRLN